MRVKPCKVSWLLHRAVDYFRGHRELVLIKTGPPLIELTPKCCSPTLVSGDRRKKERQRNCTSQGRWIDGKRSVSVHNMTCAPLQTLYGMHTLSGHEEKRCSNKYRWSYRKWSAGKHYSVGSGEADSFFRVPIALGYVMEFRPKQVCQMPFCTIPPL